MVTALAILGWTTAARLGRRADTVEALARYAEERNQTIEIAGEQLRVNETNARWAAQQAEELASRLKLRVALLEADLIALREMAGTPSDELLDSTAKRLRKFPSLAAKPDV